MKTLVFAGGGLLFGGCNTVPADPLRTTYEKRDVMQEVMARNDKVVLLSSEELRRDKPLLLLLHGATDDPTEMMGIAREWMETHNVLLYSYNFHHPIRRIGLRLVREMKPLRAATDNTNLTVITYSYSAIIFRKTILLPGAADVFADASLIQLVPTAGGSFLARSLAYRFAISLVSLASKASAAQSPYGSIAKELWDGDGNKNFSRVIHPERVHTLLLENDAQSADLTDAPHCRGVEHAEQHGEDEHGPKAREGLLDDVVHVSHIIPGRWLTTRSISLMPMNGAMTPPTP